MISVGAKITDRRPGLLAGARRSILGELKTCARPEACGPCDEALRPLSPRGKCHVWRTDHWAPRTWLPWRQGRYPSGVDQRPAV